MEASNKKKVFNFPSAFTILFFILILAVGLTWVIPSGSYSKLTYNMTEKVFVVKAYGEQDKTYPATEETLNNLNIKIKLSNFTEGVIKKPIAIPGTYQRIEQHYKGIKDIPISMVEGTIEAVDVMVFIFVLGGMIGVINRTGSFNAGLMALARRTKGNEFMIVFSVSVLMVLGGTTCGIEEEAVAFYPILVPVFLALGYDAIICVGAIFLASSMGTAFSTINPFSVVIASNAAGIQFTEGIGFRAIGLLLGATCVISYLYWYGKKVKADDEADSDEITKTYEEIVAEYGKLPGGLMSLAPIIVPVLLMAVASIVSMMKISGTGADILKFIGTPIIALAVGTVFGVLQLYCTGKMNEFYNITNETLKTVGPILFVTAAGGVLGKVIASSDMVNFIKDHAEVLSTMGMLFPFLLSAILKSAQGSSTVALTTTAGIVAPLLPALGFASPMSATLVTMAIGAGAMTVSHANDSYFWVVTNFGAMSPEKGYKTQTMCTLFLGIAGIIEIMILSLFLH